MLNTHQLCPDLPPSFRLPLRRGNATVVDQDVNSIVELGCFRDFVTDIGNVPKVAKRGIELGGAMVLLQVDSGVLELFFVNVKKVDSVAFGEEGAGKATANPTSSA